VRTSDRERELAVRSALGGSRGRLIRQLLSESLLLAVVSTIAGVGLGWLGIQLLMALGPENLPRIDRVAINPMVVTFTALAGLVSAVVFGLVPAMRASRPDVMDLLRRAGRTGNLSSGAWLRNSVVVIEVALSFVLLVGSGLMIRSFIALQRTAPGYDPNGVLTFFIPNLRLPDMKARQAFMRDLPARIGSLSGVQAVTAASPLPLEPRDGLTRWGTEEALSDPAKFQQATLHVVLPGYFEAMRTRLVEGRTFTDADNQPEARVIVIDRLLARKAFPGQSAVGRTLLARARTPEAERFQIIGVVDHQRHHSLAREGREAFFITDAYMGYGAASRWAVRTTGDPTALDEGVRAAVSELNPRAGVIDVQPMLSFVERAQAQTKFALVLIAIFAAIALLLASVGLYSVLSTAVCQRTAEIGVRMAFGAAHGNIFRLVVGQGLKLSAAELLLGWRRCADRRDAVLVGVEPTSRRSARWWSGSSWPPSFGCRHTPADPMVALRDSERVICDGFVCVPLRRLSRW
jgi:putative ABC transport system permease protein